MPYISVVIPCYNTSNYIVRCLEALERQSFKNFDVILVDDCSKDNTVAVIKEYQSTSSLAIQLLHNDVNSGPARSRHKGIVASNADFICFCDSDDWYDPNYLQEMMASQSDNGSDIVFCSYRLVLESGKRIERLHYYEKDELKSTRRAIIKGPDSLCLMMVRRSIIVNLPSPNMRNGEDMAIIPLIISMSKTYSAVNKCMYNYYCRDGSASMRPSMEMIENLEKSFSFVEQNLSSSFQIEKEFIGVRNLLYGGLINLFKFSNNKKKANQIVNDFESSFPLWNENPNLHELPCFKRVFLQCVYKRYWFFARQISTIHGLLLK